METWLNLARDNRRTASRLIQMGEYRSAISRAYYAAYSKVTLEFAFLGMSMPPDREGPSHKKMRPMIECNLIGMEKSRRLALSSIFGRLYAMRIIADYSPSAAVEAGDGREAITLMNKVFYGF